MFERRLKIFLLLLGAMVAGLLARGAQVQIVQREYWRQQAMEAMKRAHFVETSRGRILDFMGRPLAEDQPCIDACVEYRAIQNPPDEEWVKLTALRRLHARIDGAYVNAGKTQRKQMLHDELDRVRVDVKQMWETLARISSKSPEEIDAARDAITRRVEMRRRYVWYHNFQRAAARQAASHEEVAAWKRWVIEGGTNMPDVDKFQITVAEQLEPHVVLPAVSNETQNELGKDIDRYPGLVLRPGTHRFYPYHDVACHLLGQLAKVDRQDLDKDEKNEKDELRQYLPNDQIGRSGVESLCEPALRGTRGRYEKVMGDERIVSSQEPVVGQDVRLTIDVELQQQVQAAFESAILRVPHKPTETAVLHGAAVLIDVKTDEVRALVSYPTYDNNEFEEQYAKLHDDDLNQPLMNRATMSQLEPGSTVKPMVGLAAIASGVLGIDEGIECTGFLIIGGKTYRTGRCWVASRYEGQIPSVAHHPIPIPHQGHDGNADGFLTFSDALERSCNIFFENCGERLGVYPLSEWFYRFGLGRPTGIGIAEARGLLPTYRPLPASVRHRFGWFAAIGQGHVAATPIQMANVAATIARDGIWMRPTLLAPLSAESSARPATRPGALPDSSDRVDLHLPPEAMKAAHDGMFRVVNSAAGTGTGLVNGETRLEAVKVAGKTGTAQASRLRVRKRDENTGRLVLDAHGKPTYTFLEPSTPDNPNLKALWYRGAGNEGKDLNHAWYIGFAPADHPQVAFAVMVEYGGSGGVAAASVAREALEGCLMRNYLTIATSVEKQRAPQ